MIDKGKKMILKKFPALLILAIFMQNSCLSAQEINREQILKTLEVLSHDSLKGRKTGTEGARSAADYIISEYKNIGLRSFEEGYKHEFTLTTGRKKKEVKGHNLVGYLEGNKDEYIVFSAHYDHLGIKAGKIYNGADDNASGVSALLALARYFSKNRPEHSLIFAAFDAEEMGLVGSKTFVGDPPVTREKIKLNINMDMVSYNRNKEIYAVGTYHNPQFKSHLEKIAEKAEVHLLFGHDNPDEGTQLWTFSSDHGPFHRKGIPFIYFGVEDHEHYHKPSDDYENIDPDFFYNVVKLILDFSVYIDKILD